MSNAFVLKQQAQAFIDHVARQPRLAMKLAEVVSRLSAIKPDSALAITEALPRIRILAIDPSITTTTFDGLCQGLLHSVILNGADDVDPLGDELRAAFRVLGLPEIPRRQRDFAAFKASVDAFLEKTGGVVDELSESYLGAIVSQNPSLA